MPRFALVALLAVLLLGLPACGAGGALEEFVDSIGNGGPSSGSIPDDTPIVPGTTFTEGELAWAHEVLALVNEERAAADLPPLLFHDGASEVAQAHNRDMRDRNFFAHINPDEEGPQARLNAAGIFPRSTGENIAQGQGTPAIVMAAWMGSDGHRANILRTTFTHVGIGVLRTSGGPWWTQVFMRE